MLPFKGCTLGLVLFACAHLPPHLPSPSSLPILSNAPLTATRQSSCNLKKPLNSCHSTGFWLSVELSVPRQGFSSSQHLWTSAWFSPPNPNKLKVKEDLSQRLTQSIQQTRWDGGCGVEAGSLPLPSGRFVANIWHAAVRCEQKCLDKYNAHRNEAMA